MVIDLLLAFSNERISAMSLDVKILYVK